MPNRILKESICTSEQIEALNPFEETLFYRLIVNADDYGRFDGRPAIIRGRLFPLKNLRDKQIEDALHTLSSEELVEVYTVDGKPFVRLTGWERHQNVRAKKPRYPSPEKDDGNTGLNTSASICKQMYADDSICIQKHTNVSVIQSVSNPNPNPNPNPIQREEAHAQVRRFSPPTVEEVRRYCEERKNGVDAERFVNFYASKGWKVGNQTMKDWQACVRTWEKRDSGAAPSGYSAGYVRPENPKNHYEQRSYTDKELEDAVGTDELLREARENYA